MAGDRLSRQSLFATTVDGNGRNPGLKELVAVGTAAGLKADLCKTIASEIDTCVKEMLGAYVL